jgi:GTP cyclohydrolase III
LDDWGALFFFLGGDNFQLNLEKNHFLQVLEEEKDDQP